MTIERPVETPADEPQGWLLDSEQLAATREMVAKRLARAERKGYTGNVTVEAVEVREWVYDTFEYNAPANGALVTTRPDGVTTNVPTYNGNVVPGMWVEVISYRTTITGEAPCYGGWMFVATLDWDPAAGLIVRATPGADPVDRSSLREGWCDECQTVRYRSETYLVINRETGEQRQVGSTCIKDFLGWDTMPQFLDGRGVRDDVDELLAGWSTGGYRDCSTLTALAVAWAVITTHGWVPASQEWNTPTKGRVLDVLYPANAKQRKAAMELAPVIDQAYDRAREIRAFIDSPEFSGESDYVLNLKAVLRADNVTTRNLGLLVSAPQAHARHLEQTLVRARAADLGANSQWIGTPGERREFTATVISKKYTGEGYNEGDVKVLYTLLTDDGNIIKHWSQHHETASGVFGDKEGVTVTFKATIKKDGGHSEYRGVKETTVQRPANVVITEAAK